MIRFQRSTARAAGFAALILIPTMGLASAEPQATAPGGPSRGATAEMRLAHTDAGRGGGPGMMAPGQPHGSGVCRGGMPDYGGGAGMMGPGMMGQGMMGRANSGAHYLDDRVVPSRDLTVDDVRHFLEHRLVMGGNKRLKLGEVTEADGDRILAEINTLDGSLVERFEVDRHSGQMRSIE